MLSDYPITSTVVYAAGLAKLRLFVDGHRELVYGLRRAEAIQAYDAAEQLG